ncbi:C40 family peptidase [Sporosarcina sp. Te-1]|uniref:C40 family peptidase n=1 Tax=Sporosarcina sp. Te-1 TaxID=2818390 RepID=UPI001A9E7E95|nr:C40 family peptidase [Sporosarcina sp. Te-1]QTD41123.1 C40 family peptidase [Sporosarcina sp. Te-1]
MKAKVLSLLATAALATALTAGQADAASDTYVVKKGDTLWKIASAHKLSVDELKSLNQMQSESIKIDQKLVVTKKPGSAKQPAVTQTSKTTTAQSLAVSKETSSTNQFKAPAAQVDKPHLPSNHSQAILAAATEVSLPLLDTPYVWAGVTPEGFDCSGFIYYVFRTAGLDLPRLDTVGMYTNATIVDEPVPGDLVFFQNTYREGISHAGIYLGDGNFIHAGTKKVEVTSLNSAYWKDKFVGYKRFNQLLQ